MKMLRPGRRVFVDDPFGYSGSGTVVLAQREPHPAYLVRMDWVDGKRDYETWVLEPHVKATTKSPDPDRPPRRPGETVNEWTGRMLGERRDV